MKNFKLTVSYDGTRYNGWQKQGNTKNTIQERFENILQKMCDANIEVYASGRTDAGVHALGQVINFKCETYKNADEVKEYINRYLPDDILVLKAEEADERFHSRLCAKSKTYEYTIVTEKPDVFIRKYVYRIEGSPDISKMRKAAEKICGTHDFKGFSSLGKTKKSTVREVNFINIEHNGSTIRIIINANGFLYNMVRIICGTLLEIGTGELDENIIHEIFSCNIREKAGKTLPACGLKLTEVFYSK